MTRTEYAALLDLDGTLIDSLHIYYIAVSKVLAMFDVRCTLEEMYELAGFSGIELYTHFLKKHDKYDPSMDEELYITFDTCAREMIKDVPFPNESVDTIATLKDMGYKVAICTGANHWFVNTAVPNSVIDSIDSVVTCDDVRFGKPHPETFLMAADEIGVHPSNCIVVGDSINDLKGAERAGMRFVLVRNKYNTDINEGYVREINSIEEFIT